MGGIFEAFEVYNKNKHSSHPRMFGGTSNTGGTRTDYLYSSEHYTPKQQKMDKEELLGQSMGESAKMTGLPADKMVDISHMSQHELEELMKGLRKGEPNNRVNF
ncbi:LADA_0G09670g1_1 [Lachancea dasiensis]|uniref:Stationary phase protein 4 n=1 Tax=Lachancea dasiensis TaxID=1072105 RepID=A0A1G4JUH4_9SACH|nr:LADA_0G09670g1_1 [Lachancea dasiensis]